MGPSTVAQILRDQSDSTGATIKTVYAKVVPRYAVYRTDERVLVQYADDEALGSEQRRALIDSNPLKGEINGLIDGWRRSSSAAQVTRASLFDRRTADALVVALQGDNRSAVDLLNGIKADIVAERTSIARTSYLFTSCAVTVIVALTFALICSRDDVRPGSFASDLSLSVIVGALGAFFSIALAIRGRQIGTDLQWRDNHADAALRVVIGAISGAVLFCLLQAKIVTLGFDAGTALDENEPFSKASFAFLIVAAFVAGFTERLVGDLLGRATVGTDRTGTNPLAGSSVPSKIGPLEERATETNPLGHRASTPLSTQPQDHRESTPDSDDVRDGCLDHVVLKPEEMTQDVELPPATGGIAGRQ